MESFLVGFVAGCLLRPSLEHAASVLASLATLATRAVGAPRSAAVEPEPDEATARAAEEIRKFNEGIASILSFGKDDRA